MVGSLFMGVFGVATEAIVHLFCLDEEIEKEKYADKDQLAHGP